MEVLAWGRGYSGLALLSALCQLPGGPRVVGAVVDAEAARAARAVSALRGLDVRGHRDDVEEPAFPDAPGHRLLSLGPPAGSGDRPAVPSVVVSVIGSSIDRGADPLPWALAAGMDVVTLVVDRVPGTRCVHQLRLLPEGGLRDAGEAAIRLLAPCLGGPCGSPVEAVRLSDGARREQPALPCLALPTRLDWSMPTDRIIRLVRAWGPPAPGAWTTWREVQLFVSSAFRDPAPGWPVAPGTVVEAAATGIVVAAVDGAVRMTGLRDVIGSVDGGSIAVGDLLGGDPVAELARLEQRVRDLECIVRRLADGVAFL
ncbi:hypothetical protein ACN267_21675 [Micromonospora sp. WMMD734]|uniref:hypothetical protein n=1 Tax=unclassified Micromonospora TaxID=2617518 RepID=UPI00241773F6|nr:MULTISPECIES: hypothetical protein [unclassified Micromonospora]MDG4816991.1 hypothetical protein [Micromonospora sp. WMMD956]WFE59490.1 hypothetical protein O7633_22740 [Micromonospora sp. WMMD712]